MRLFLLIAGFTLSACDVFDANLYMALERGDGGPLTDSDSSAMDSGTRMDASDFDAAASDSAVVDTGAIDAGHPLVLAETCLDGPPVVESSTIQREVDTSDLSDDIRALATCTGSDAPGNDGFFQVAMQAGQKWHFHVKSLVPDRNPAIYLLRSSCDERTCQVGDAIDECGANSDEHLSFIAQSTGTYFIGLDDRNSGGGRYRLLAVNPVCGNGGTLEHSETCDDGNTMSGDGCDDKCRVELAQGTQVEVEPNDEVTDANVIQIDGGVGSLAVRGRLGGRCDFDMYAVDVPEGGSLGVSMLLQSGEPCPDETPAATMRVFRSDGLTLLGSGTVREGNACPAIDENSAFAQALSAGQYLVRVSIGDRTDVLDYRLTLEVREATP